MYILLQIKYCMDTGIQCLNFADNRIPVHVFTVTKTKVQGKQLLICLLHINITYNLNVKVFLIPK